MGAVLTAAGLGLAAVGAAAPAASADAAITAPPVGMVAAPHGTGYVVAARDGGTFAFGSAGFYGSMGGKPLGAPVVGIAGAPGGKGYWEVASDGGIFAFGSAGFYGSMAGKPLNKPVVSIAATPDGKGYWEVASDGGIFAFGDAGFYGSMAGKPLNKPVVSIAATPDGKGYWEVASDGGIFAFGDAGFYGSMAGKPLNKPVVSIAATPDGKGYWLLGADGGVFAFGNVLYYGRVVYSTPTSGPVAVPSGNAAALARQLLANPRVAKTGRLVLADLQDTAAGRAGTSGKPVSATVLRLLVTLAQSHSFTISALESGGSGHTTGSLHYSGDAVDLSTLDGHSLTGRDSGSRTVISLVAPLMPSGSGFGQSNCYAAKAAHVALPAGVGEFTDTCNHLHIQVTRNSA
nr:hypothetical protein [Streptomyces sp. 846.5]